MPSAIVLDAAQAKAFRDKLDYAMTRLDKATSAILGLGSLLADALPGTPGPGLKTLMNMIASDLEEAEGDMDAVFEGIGGDYDVSGRRVS